MAPQRVHLLARALIFRGSDEIMVAQAAGWENTFLPGGHRDPGESLSETVERELLEELGIKARTVAYLGAVEWQYPEPEPTEYEVNHVFLTEIDPSPELCSREPHLRFRWCPIAELDEAQLEPVALRQLIARLAAGDRGVWWATNVGRAPLGGH